MEEIIELEEIIEASVRRSTEAEALREIIRLILNVDVKIDKDRRRETVNAKMIYSKILRKNNWTLKYIGRSIEKDHTTIIHYLKSMEGYMKSDINLVKSFNRVYEEFCIDNDPLYYASSDDIKRELISLRIKNKKLELSNEKLLLENKDIERLKSITNLIKQKTPSGVEHIIYSKMLNFFDEVYNL